MKEINLQLQNTIDLSNISEQEEIIYLGCSANNQILITTRFNSVNSTCSIKFQNKKQQLYNLYLEIENAMELQMFKSVKVELFGQVILMKVFLEIEVGTSL